MSGIVKAFPGVLALNRAGLRVIEGEAMALLGENGAGKSTLMKILTGVYRKDAGTVRYDGRDVAYSSAREASLDGIAIIHQELNLIPHMKVYENVFLGRELRKKMGSLDIGEMIRRTSLLLERIHVDMDPTREVRGLSIAMQQMVEIAKALSLDSRIIIMDEPTGALPDEEVDSLLSIINELKGQNKGIVYITHRLQEVFRICDRVTVLRDGELIGERPVAGLGYDELVSMMVGRQMNNLFPYLPPSASDETVLSVKRLSNELVRDISFDVKRGNVVGIAGLAGAGRTELAKTLYGVFPKTEGTVEICGRRVDIGSPRQAIQNGIFYVSEDRKSEGLLLELDVKTNITLAALRSITRFGRINLSEEKRVAEKYRAEMQIKTPDLLQRVKNLSGGNQQKVVLSKGLLSNPELLILDEPTRGIDVGAKKEIYVLINQLKSEGKAILLISSEMSEVLGICDYILVMHEGRLKTGFAKEEASQEKIMNAIMAR
jgi:ribose transport system ATP-binding protein